MVSVKRKQNMLTCYRFRNSTTLSSKAFIEKRSQTVFFISREAGSEAEEDGAHSQREDRFASR